MYCFGALPRHPFRELLWKLRPAGADGLPGLPDALGLFPEFELAGGRHVGDGFTCGLRESGAIDCWGVNQSVNGVVDQTEPPEGHFTAISGGANDGCAIRESGELACWGTPLWGNLEAPPGAFQAVGAGYTRTCAVAESGEIACWGSIFHPWV